MKQLLSHFNLGDTYEIQARVLPAMLIVLPVAVLVAQIASAKGNWLAMVGYGAGLEVVLAILVSRVAHALGARLQARLEKQWGALPTHAWLRPNDTTHSEQQKRTWRKAVSELSGLDLENALNTQNTQEVNRLIADAIMVCRNRIRGDNRALLLQTYNITYGFARNLAGMKWLSLTICIACSAASATAWLRFGFDPAGTVIHLLFLVIAAIYCWLANGYVQHCAVRYAEFFFAAVTNIANPTVNGSD